MSKSGTSLQRHERLRGVTVARAILRDAFGLELVFIDECGPLAHRSGGVMRGSNELCRAMLFARDGYTKCTAFYAQLGADRGAGTHRCHAGLLAASVPVIVGGDVLGHLAASGFLDPRSPDGPPPTAAELAAALAALDPNYADPSAATRNLPIVAGDRVKVVGAILRAAADDIVAQEEEEASARDDSNADELPGFWGIVGASPAMRALFARLARVVHSEASVLITGESGTGKELVARALHDRGPRGDAAFVATNCGAVGDDVLESALFGHVRGAFSGAIRASDGLFGAANGGTLFLDEVGEMSAAMQVKLLRVLQDGSYLPVGATKPKRANLRVVAASHRDLSELVSAGVFRQDLFYRLHVLTLLIPPLRDRPGDLDLFLRYFMQQVDGVPSKLAPASVRCLERYTWPGNVRELRSEVERWAVSARGELEVGPEHLSAEVREAGGYAGSSGGEAAAAAAAAGTGTLRAAIDALERAIVRRGLERTEGNRTQLAKELGISRTTLNDRLKRFELV